MGPVGQLSMLHDFWIIRPGLHWQIFSVLWRQNFVEKFVFDNILLYKPGSHWFDNVSSKCHLVKSNTYLWTPSVAMDWYQIIAFVVVFYTLLALQFHFNRAFIFICLNTIHNLNLQLNFLIIERQQRRRCRWNHPYRWSLLKPAESWFEIIITTKEYQEISLENNFEWTETHFRSSWTL